MLWLAGLMGLLAVSAVAYVEVGNDETDVDADADSVEDLPPQADLDPTLDAQTEVRVSGELTQSAAVAELDDMNASPNLSNTAPEASITDFEPEDDSLLFVWDDSDADSEPPLVSIQPDPDNEGQLQVWLQDDMVAQISGQEDLSEADISLIPLSSAIELELVDA
ncbi:MAG: hypothetical protein ABJL67_04775 [Sulfitobacter sp.]